MQDWSALRSVFRNRWYWKYLQDITLTVLLFVVALIPISEPTVAPAVAEDDKRVTLIRGTPTTLEISPNQTQIVDLPANAHQFIQVSINKGDLNLSFSIQDPADRTVVESKSYSYEPVQLSFISSVAGTYRLKLHSLERTTSIRRLVVDLNSQRPITANDSLETSASQAFATAGQLRWQWTKESLRAAVEKYKEAASNWRSCGNWIQAANTLAEAAEVLFVAGEYRQALDQYQQAIEIAKTANDLTLLSLYFSHAARLHSLLGNIDEERTLAGESLKYVRREASSLPEDTKHVYGEILGYVGEVYYEAGDLMRARDYLQQSEKLLTETGDRDGAARTRLFLGYVSVTMGDRERAMSQFGESLNSFREVNNKSGEGLALTAIGTGHSFHHVDETALKLHREAREIFRAIGDRQSEAITLNGIAQAYQNLHEYDLALKHYEDALKQFQENGSIDFVTVGLCLIGSVYEAKGETARALSYYEKCADVSRTAGKDRILAYAMDFIAAVYAKDGSRSQALAQYNELLEFHTRTNDHRGQALTLNNLGDLYLASGDIPTALKFYGRALPVSKQAGESGVELATLYSFAKAERAAGNLDQALDHIKTSINIIEASRSNLASPNFRSAYFAGYRQHYDLYINLLMRLDQERPGKGYAAAALLTSENSRARSLREMLAELGTDIRQGLDEATLKRESQLQQLLSAQAQAQPGLSSQGQANNQATDLDLLRAEYEEIQARIRHHNPQYESLLQPAPLSIPDIQAMLDGNTVLLEYSLGPDESFLWAITKDSLNAYFLPAKSTLEPAVLELYRLITARQPPAGGPDKSYQARVEEADRQLDEKARNVSRMLLGPVAPLLGNKRILIVAEGALQYTAFDALPIPDQNTRVDQQPEPLLISTNELVILPSVSTLAAIRADDRPRNTSSNLVAVFADPVFTASDDRLESNKNSSDPENLAVEYSRSVADPGLAFARQNRSGLNRLIHTSEEAEAIRRAARAGAWVVEGFDATRQQAISEQIGTYKIVHFATHGLVNAEHPELSGIVLSMLKPDGSLQNGFLQLHDIYRLRLSADLTVLSACNSALGKDVKGEGLIGLTRGFMYAGSRSVVASLWEVDDRATAVLMENFYAAMLRDGLTPAAALRSAKESVRKQPAWRHPYFWAGFVLQGEYREPITINSGWSFWQKALLVIAITAVAVLLALKLRRSTSQKPA